MTPTPSRPVPTTLLMHQRMDIRTPGSNRNTSLRQAPSSVLQLHSNMLLPCRPCTLVQPSRIHR